MDAAWMVAPRLQQSTAAVTSLSPKSSGAAQAGVRRSFDDRRTGATDDTTRMMARAVSTSLPDGQSLVFQQQYDWWGDLYDGPHPFKVGKADFKSSTHFYNKTRSAGGTRRSRSSSA